MSIQHFVLTHVEEEYAPPAMEVLDITVIGGHVFIDICKWEETSDTRTLKRVAPGMTVHLDDLYDSLFAARNSDLRSTKRVQEKKKKKNE